MDKVSITIVILKMLLQFLLRDSDKDGRIDIFDSEPNNPEVK